MLGRGAVPRVKTAGRSGEHSGKEDEIQSMQSSAPASYRVGDLTIDVGRARVERAGQVLTVPKLTFDLLMTLVEAAPSLVSLDRLMDQVWPGLVVSPETVSQRIKLLRIALGDDAAQPRYLVGVRGRGYRLIAEVRRLDAGAMTDSTASAAATAAPVAVADATPKRRSLRTVLTVTGIGAAVVLALGLWVQRTSRHSAPLVVQRSAEPVPAPVPAPRSIAVLPFEDLGATSTNGALALGIPESILHQLASLRDLLVIARTSSFAFKDKAVDAREIGRELNVRYLLEGSVQTENSKLRVVAQLIDATSGVHVWSMRFDKATYEVFSVQDDIARAVARAMALSVNATATDHLLGQGTTNLEAYLAYLEGRALMSNTRIVDMRTAALHFQTAIREDPRYALAYLALVDAELQAAEYEMSDNREGRVRAAIQQGWILVDKALKLDPDNGAAYVIRARLESYMDAPAAEADYRQGIQLSPNYPPGYEGLAELLAETPAHAAEALALLDKARALDPLEPRYEVTRAVFQHFRLGQTLEPTAELESLLKRHPTYAPALAQLALLRDAVGRSAEAVRLYEQTLKLDAKEEIIRRSLIQGYIGLGDLKAARSVAAEGPGQVALRQLPLLLAEHEWRKAGELAYHGLALNTVTAYDEPPVVLALRLHAEATGDYPRARDALQKLAGVSWDSQGHPRRDGPPDIQIALVGLAAILQKMGDPTRAAQLIELQFKEQRAATAQFAARWYTYAHSEALALSGNMDAALGLVAGRRTVALENAWYCFEFNPTLDSVRATPRFQQLKRECNAGSDKERALLATYRAQGLVPDRDAGTGTDTVRNP